MSTTQLAGFTHVAGAVDSRPQAKRPTSPGDLIPASSASFLADAFKKKKKTPPADAWLGT